MHATWKVLAVRESRRHAHVLVDTGPIVAILNRDDEHHIFCTETLKQIEPPLLTCWPVLTEAAWLLRTDARAMNRLLHGGRLGLFRLLDLGQDELTAIDELYKRYRDLSPQLADLSLVHLAQREQIDTVFTIDRRDFMVYRYKGKTGFKLLPTDDE